MWHSENHSRRVAMLVQSRSRTPEDTQKKLFTPVRIGPITLKHRVVMPPLSRLRAHKLTGVPSELIVEYYGQRASDGGLIITEATAVSPLGAGNHEAPAIFSRQHADA